MNKTLLTMESSVFLKKMTKNQISKDMLLGTVIMMTMILMMRQLFVKTQQFRLYITSFSFIHLIVVLCIGFFTENFFRD